VKHKLLVSPADSFAARALSSALRFRLVIYSKLRHQDSANLKTEHRNDIADCVAPAANDGSEALDIPVELYPFDMSRASMSFFTERRAGKRFEIFERAHENGPLPG